MRRILFILIALAVSVSLLKAEPFRIVGSRPLGMGGAYVAVVGGTPSSSDALIQYWNPAALGLHKGWDGEMPLSFGIEATGGILNLASEMADSADKISAITDAQDAGSFFTLQQLECFTTALEKLEKLNTPGMGFMADVGAGVNSSFGRWAFSVNNFITLGVDPNIDLANLFLGSGTVTASSISRSSKFAGGDYSGIDLSKLPNIAALAAEPSDSGLSTASNELASTIDTLATQSGVNLGGYTADQIANALVNYADSQGVSRDDIINSVNTIKDLQPLLENLLAGGDPSDIFSNNDSNITIKGISTTEFSLGHGRSCSFTNLEYLNDLYVGGNIKYIKGTVGYYRQSLWSEDSSGSGDLYDYFKTNTKVSSNIGLDLGLLYDRKKDYRTRVGLTAKNINKPSFAQPDAAKENGDDSKYIIYPQWRFGAASWPLNWIVVALDYDLTKNPTLIDGYNNQLLSMGFELNAINREYLNIAFRMGLLKNVAESGSNTYTGGIGFNLMHFMLELAGAVSSEKAAIEDGEEIPANAYAGISMGINF